MSTAFLKSSLLAVALIALGPSGSRILAQGTNQAPLDKKSAAPAAQKSQVAKKPGPFRGKLAALNKTAKTITVGKRTFQITSQTRINKTGQSATLDDAVVGELVSGYVKPTEDGKWVATTLNLGPKADSKTKAPSRTKNSREKQAD